MEEHIETRTPWHLWVVGILSLLWNAFGCYDYFMTRSQGADYIRAMMHTDQAAAIMAYINSFPIWVSIAWGLGVWGALAGSILLLLRHRLAEPVFLVSLIGAIVGIGYQLLNPSGIAEMNEGINRTMPYVILIVAAALYAYARVMRTRGVLR